MKKAHLLLIYPNLREIGRVFSKFNNGFPLSASAISQWGEQVPPLREYQLREQVPDIDRRIAAARGAISRALVRATDEKRKLR